MPPPRGLRIATSAGSKPFGISSTRAAGCLALQVCGRLGRDSDERRRAVRDPRLRAGAAPGRHDRRPGFRPRGRAARRRAACRRPRAGRRSARRTEARWRARRRSRRWPAGAGSPSLPRAPRASTAASPRGEVPRAGRPGRRALPAVSMTLARALRLLRRGELVPAAGRDHVDLPAVLGQVPREGPPAGGRAAGLVDRTMADQQEPSHRPNHHTPLRRWPRGARGLRSACAGAAAHRRLPHVLRQGHRFSVSASRLVAVVARELGTSETGIVPGRLQPDAPARPRSAGWA